MDIDAIWTEIDAHRARTVDLLADLDDGEWQTLSLCAGWTVKNVAAHLTIQQAGPGDVLRMLAESPRAALRLDMNTMIREAAVRRSAWTTAEVIEAIGGMIGSRRHNLGVTPYETLIDICVHSQDIAMPLGRQLPLDTRAAATAATRVWRRGWPWYPQRQHAGRRFVATDCDWAVGEGAEASGPIEAVLLVLTGREVGWRRMSEAQRTVMP